MSVSFTYINGAWSYPRSYLSGFSLQGNLDFLAIDADGISLHQAFLDIFFFLKFRHDLFPWSSNSYTLDHTFTPAGSFATVGGVPANGGVIVERFVDFNDGLYYIKVQALAATSPSNLVALPPAPPTYWLPQQ